MWNQATIEQLVQAGVKSIGVTYKSGDRISAATGNGFAAGAKAAGITVYKNEAIPYSRLGAGQEDLLGLIKVMEEFYENSLDAVAVGGLPVSFLHLICLP